MDVIFGDAIERTAQFIVGMGWKMRTAESMREAAQKLNGMRTFLTFVGAGLGEGLLSHEEVKEVGAKVGRKLADVFEHVIGGLPAAKDGTGGAESEKAV